MKEAAIFNKYIQNCMGRVTVVVVESRNDILILNSD